MYWYYWVIVAMHVRNRPQRLMNHYARVHFLRHVTNTPVQVLACQNAVCAGANMGKEETLAVFAHKLDGIATIRASFGNPDHRCNHLFHAPRRLLCVHLDVTHETHAVGFVGEIVLHAVEDLVEQRSHLFAFVLLLGGLGLDDRFL